jgi:septum formation protein
MQQRLILAYTLIHIIGRTGFISTKLPHTADSVAAAALQQQQQQQRQFIPPRSSHFWKRPPTPVTQASSIYLYVSSQKDCLWTVSQSRTRMMNQATVASESTQDTITQRSPLTRPELVLSIKHYLQCNTDYSNDAKNDTNNSNSNSNGTANIQLVLASASPRRREILDMMGLPGQYVVIPSPLNETQVQIQLRKQQNNHIDPIQYTRTLAEQKAYAVAYDLLSQHRNNNRPQPTTQLILGSDTVVAITNDRTNITTLLEKPSDAKDAVRMLQQLQNKSHVVYTGVAIVRYTPAPLSSTASSLTQEKSFTTDDNIPNINRDGYYQDTDRLSSSIQLVQSFVETATVHISAMNEIDIAAYVATQEPMDKAGAYGIQGVGGQIVTKIDGDFFTVRHSIRIGVVDLSCSSLFSFFCMYLPTYKL